MKTPKLLHQAYRLVEITTGNGSFHSIRILSIRLAPPSSRRSCRGALADYDEAIRLKPDPARALKNREAVRKAIAGAE